MIIAITLNLVLILSNVEVFFIGFVFGFCLFIFVVVLVFLLFSS